MIELPLPADMYGPQLVDELEAAGYSDVTLVVAGDRLIINAAELVDPMPAPAEREACSTQEELNALLESGVFAAGAADAAALAAISAVLAAHLPSPPPLPPTKEEQVAKIVDVAPDWQTAVKTLAAEGLLA